MRRIRSWYTGGLHRQKTVHIGGGAHRSTYVYRKLVATLTPLTGRKGWRLGIPLDTSS